MGDVESGIFIVDVCIEHWGSVPISTIPPWTHRSFRLIELASALSVPRLWWHIDLRDPPAHQSQLHNHDLHVGRRSTLPALASPRSAREETQVVPAPKGIILRLAMAKCTTTALRMWVCVHEESLTFCRAYCASSPASFCFQTEFF